MSDGAARNPNSFRKAIIILSEPVEDKVSNALRRVVFSEQSLTVLLVLFKLVGLDKSNKTIPIEGLYFLFASIGLSVICMLFFTFKNLALWGYALVIRGIWLSFFFISYGTYTFLPNSSIVFDPVCRVTALIITVLVTMQIISLFEHFSKNIYFAIYIFILDTFFFWTVIDLFLKIAR